MKMKKFILTIIVSLCMSATYADTMAADADSAKIVSLLQEAKKLPEGANLMIHFARKLMNVPYVAHTLEVNKEERLVINIHQLDCTTFVENVLTLAWCASRKKDDYKTFRETLRQVRYIGGKIGYTSRQHYFTTWIEDNTRDGFVKEIQQPNPPFSTVQKVSVNYMTTHPQSYKMLKEHPNWLPFIRQQEKSINGKQYRYIPKSSTGKSALMKSAVQDGDIIAIVTNTAGLDIAHVGIAVWHKDGLHMINASMIHKKVVDEPMTLDQYLQKHKSHLGIRIIRPQL